MLIINCEFHGPIGCTQPMLRITPGYTASCGYCDEIVYRDVQVIRNHDFSWDGYKVIWLSRDFDTEIHSCCAPEVEITEDVHELVSA